MNLFQAAIGTRTGNRHRATDTPNQDYACYALLPNNMGIVAAVSDGAGSAPKAATGSKSSAQAATRKAWKTALRLGQAPDPAICVSEGVKAARKAVEVTALVQGNSLEHYHATLLVAVMTEDKTAVAHIGDGASIVLTGDNYKMLTIPARGEYANETFFITMDDYLDLVASNETESATRAAALHRRCPERAHRLQEKEGPPKGRQLPQRHHSACTRHRRHGRPAKSQQSPDIRPALSPALPVARGWRNHPR